MLILKSLERPKTEIEGIQCHEIQQYHLVLRLFNEDIFLKIVMRKLVKGSVMKF